MNYTTTKIKEAIEAKKSLRSKAVFLAGQIKKANQSPGFDWDKAIEGFRHPFLKEEATAKYNVKSRYPEHPEDPIEWVHLIIYFSEQPYKKGEKDE